MIDTDVAVAGVAKRGALFRWENVHRNAAVKLQRSDRFLALGIPKEYVAGDLVVILVDIHGV